ncbi:MAG TPA: RNA-binding cell elongation regulator Jag/EloR [Anaerolineales bacterium]|nr:RNA-binding cell elongation regulator Jag/EloR [Anaerolineales bacterium]
MNNKQTTLEIIAPTIEEAIEQGLGELMMTEEEVDVEVLDEGSRGLFGLGTRQVRVRITVKDKDSSHHMELSSPMTSDVVENDDGIEEEPAILDYELLDQTEQVVSELLHKMKVTAQVSAHFGEEDEDGRQPIFVDIRGNDLGMLIGRKAEILNAFQYIVNLIMGKRMEHWVQIIVDVEGYRARREEQIRQMAIRLAAQAVKTGRRQVLEPMTPAERRLVHLELRDHPEVSTHSIGEDPTRKVTISPNQD